MSSFINLIAKPSWSVRPMTIQQIPLVVSWIAAIDPKQQLDEVGLINQMTLELTDATQKTSTQYYIGSFEQMPTFFLVGIPTASEYEIATLLISPLIGTELHLPLCHKVVEFVAGLPGVSRINWPITESIQYFTPWLLGLGFRELRDTTEETRRLVTLLYLDRGKGGG